MKIDNLAGRELDLAVAKHVLGYECRMTAPSAWLHATVEGRTRNVLAQM